MAGVVVVDEDDELELQEHSTAAADTNSAHRAADLGRDPRSVDGTANGPLLVAGPGHPQLVGTAGFEPATSCSQSRRAAKLRYVPVVDRRRTILMPPARSFIRDSVGHRGVPLLPAAGASR